MFYIINSGQLLKEHAEEKIEQLRLEKTSDFALAGRNLFRRIWETAALGSLCLICSN